MENSHPLVSGIIPLRNKKIWICAIFLFLFWGSGNAQSKKLRKFNNLFFEAEKQKSLGNADEAKKLYLQLYKITDTNSTVAYELGIHYLEENQRDSAIFFSEKAIELSPSNKWFKLLLAAVYQQYGSWQKQIEVLKNLKKDFPDNPDYRYELSIAYLENDEPKKAITELDDLEKVLGPNEIITEQKKTDLSIKWRFEQSHKRTGKTD